MSECSIKIDAAAVQQLLGELDKEGMGYYLAYNHDGWWLLEGDGAQSVPLRILLRSDGTWEATLNITVGEE